MNKSLWTHIQWTADGHILKKTFCLNGKPKISQHIRAISSKNVGYFEISMNDSNLTQVPQRLIHSVDNLGYLIYIDLPLPF